MQIWSLDTMGTTDSKVMVSSTTGRTANKISTRKTQKTRSVKTTSSLHQTDGTYARTESPPRFRDQGCQVQDFNYTGGAITAVGRCTKEELMAELASPKESHEQGETSSGFGRPSILASYKPFDEVDMKPAFEKKKRLSFTGFGVKYERMQQKETGPAKQRPASVYATSKPQMVEYASTTDKRQTIPSARIQLVQAKTTNKSSTSSDTKQQAATVIESHTTGPQHAASPATLRNNADSTTQNQTDEKIAQRKSLIGLLKKGVERTSNAEASKSDGKVSGTVTQQDNKPLSNGDEAPAVGFSTIIQSLANAPQHTENVENQESTGNQAQTRRSAGRSLTKLFKPLDIDEGREGDKARKETQPSSKKESSGKETQNPPTMEVPSKESQRAGGNEGSGKEAQNASKKEGFGRLFNRTGQSTSSTRRPMNRSNTVGYTLSTTENASDAAPMAQDSTRKENSTKTVEYSLTTTESSTKEAPKRKMFGRAKTIDEPETTYKTEGRTKVFGRTGHSYNVAAAAKASGDQNQTVEGHTKSTIESHSTMVTATSHTDGAQNPSTKEASTKESPAPTKKEGRTKLFGRIGQSHNASAASGASSNQNQAMGSHATTSTVESDTNKATVAGHTEESVTTSKNEGRTKLFGRIGQSYNVSSAPAAASVQHQVVEIHATTTAVEDHNKGPEPAPKKEGRPKLFGRIGQSYNVTPASETSTNQQQAVESRTTTSIVESGATTTTNKPALAGHTEGSDVATKKEGRSKLFGRISQSYNVSPVVVSHTTTTVESRTSTTTVAGHTTGAQNGSKKETSTVATQRANRNEGFGKLFGRTGQSTNTVATTGGSTTTTTTVETHTNSSAQPGQPTSPSNLVSYSASTDSQSSRDKAGFAKFFQGLVNAKAGGDAK